MSGGGFGPAPGVVGVNGSNWVEIVFVVAKIVVLVGFLGLELRYALSVPAPGRGGGGLDFGLGNLCFAPATSFVAFQGWQLLLYPQRTVEDHSDTSPTAIHVPIPTAVPIYVGVTVTTTSIVGVDLVPGTPRWRWRRPPRGSAAGEVTSSSRRRRCSRRRARSTRRCSPARSSPTA